MNPSSSLVSLARQAERITEVQNNANPHPSTTYTPSNDPIKTPTPIVVVMSTHSSSPARVAANQANAQHSTGPKTTEGKAKASLNATTTALTGRTVLLASDDRAQYERHLEAYRYKFQPVTHDEYLLVQAIADTDWRLSRIPHLILALEGKAREEMAEDFKHLEPEARRIRIELEGVLKYEKQLRNLQLQESRLHRRREKDVAELRTVQKERDARRAEELAIAAMLYVAAEHDKEPFDPAGHGFDFTLEDVKCYLKGQRAGNLTKDYLFGPQKAA